MFYQSILDIKIVIQNYLIDGLPMYKYGITNFRSKIDFYKNCFYVRHENFIEFCF